jgi:hypothetical protein
MPSENIPGTVTVQVLGATQRRRPRKKSCEHMARKKRPAFTLRKASCVEVKAHLSWRERGGGEGEEGGRRRKRRWRRREKKRKDQKP